MRRECKCPVPTQEIQLARALMRMLAAHMDLWLEDAEGNSKAPDPGRGKDMLQGLFVFCLIWAVGATVDEASRAKFDLFLRAVLRKEVPEILSTPGAPQPNCAATLKLAKPPPDKGLVYDCCFIADRGAWVRAFFSSKCSAKCSTNVGGSVASFFRVHVKDLFYENG